MKRLKSELDSDEYAKLEGMMWILRKQHECRSDADKLKLELLYWTLAIFQNNPILSSKSQNPSKYQHPKRWSIIYARYQK